MPKPKVKTKDVERVYKESQGNVSKTAKTLRISRRTVYEHLVRAGYYEFQVGGPGFLRFRRRLPKPEKEQTKSRKWESITPKEE